MNKRLKKIGGNYKVNSFDRLAKQIEGKGILLVAIVNTSCEDCQKIQDFLNQLRDGLLQKLPNLVVCYGYTGAPLSGEEPPAAPPGPQEGLDDKVKDQTKLADSKVFHWEKLPENHGYALLSSPTDVQVYDGTFDHEELKLNIVTALRRCKSPVRTLAGLPGKRQFMEAKRTGIIVETTSSTQNSEVSAVEAEVTKNEAKLKVKVYFCKGLTQEISLVKNGAVVSKQKGLSFEKFLKKMPRV